MTSRLILDSGPLGRLAHPKANPEITAWFRGILANGTEVLLSEIVDYEVRRSFLLEGLLDSVKRLDELNQELGYVPLTTGIMLRAAELWAETRKRHRPTADPHALDIDVILAAQAQTEKAIVITENVGHLAPLVETRHWKDYLTLPNTSV